MRLPKILWVLVLTLVACSSGQQSNYAADTSQVARQQDTSHYADLYPLVIQDLNKKHVTESGSYYMLTQFSDSAVKITWGNDTIKRTYDEPLDFMFAERLNVKWENKNYLILDYSTGSGAWLNVVLPLNNMEQVQEFNNGLCFDKKYNLFVTEEFADTVLAVRNLKTKATQFVIEKEKPCDAGSNDACLDTISISSKMLYYKWTTPHKYSDKKSSIEKRVRVTI
ncbi:hypothetical protein SAMN05444277_106204 [Parafilimonas terrae]|uniref:Lipoprotein n=1 Tax=Parafilimonas terrae TaxID=1465490 RepID=A0A1I5WHU2_9BACT|nr:hypothetical protein SAMN05444277_106204 [Parafilimonas terrae]